MDENPTLTEAELRQFTGTERWHRHPVLEDIILTDGAKYVADRAEAMWLLNSIAAAQICLSCLAAVPFQAWKLTVNPDHSAVLVCEDGNGDTLVTDDIPFTNFPLEKITLWCINNTILLPSEN